MSAKAVDLRSYLAELEDEAESEIVRVSREVDPIHELSAVVKKLEDRGAPAVLFENVIGSDLPVVAGLFGTKERIARALNHDVRSCVEWFLKKTLTPVSPRSTNGGPVKDVKHLGAEVDLGLLPFCVHSAEDSGRYLTSGVTIVRDPETGITRTGIYRMRVVGKNQLTLHAAHGLAEILESSSASGAPLEFVTVIGHHPSVLVASQARSAKGADALAVTGSLLGQPLAITTAETIDLPVPAFAEVVIEGRLAGRRQPEGRFGEFTYYYDTGGDVSVCEVTAVTHRQDAIFLDLHPTHREHRCLWLFPGREARLLTALRAAIPNVYAVQLPLHGAGMSAYVALNDAREGDARRALHLALSFDEYIKHAIVVDSDIDIFDDAQVWWALNVRFQADRDLLLIPDCPGTRMDPSTYGADRTGGGPLTTKAGFDATVPADRAKRLRADLIPDDYHDLNLDEYLNTTDSS